MPVCLEQNHKIKTLQDGFNSGRPYFLRPDVERCRRIADELTQLSEAERRRVEAKSRFQRAPRVHRVVQTRARRSHATRCGTDPGRF